MRAALCFSGIAERALHRIVFVGLIVVVALAHVVQFHVLRAWLLLWPPATPILVIIAIVVVVFLLLDPQIISCLPRAISDLAVKIPVSTVGRIRRWGAVCSQIRAGLKIHEIQGMSAIIRKEPSTNVIIFVEKDMVSEGERRCRWESLCVAAITRVRGNLYRNLG